MIVNDFSATRLGGTRDVMNRIYILNEQNIDLTDVAVAACPEHDGELGNLQEEEIASYIENLQYPRRYGYFNAGVLLINLNYWRDNAIGDKLITYLAENYEKCLMLDQDVLNAVLYNKKKEIALKYNVMTHYLKGYNDTENPYIQENPVIVHYSGGHKPWDWNVADYPFKKEWEHCRDISLWSDWKVKFSLKERLKIFLST